MARAAGLRDGDSLGIIRTVVGVIAADSSTLTDANFDPTDANAVFGSQGFDSILLGVEIDGGTNPTATIELLFRDAEAPDGSRWKRMLLGAPPGVTLAALANETSGALASGANLVELRTFGHALIYPRITTVANPGSTTGMRILARPGRKRSREY